MWRRWLLPTRSLKARLILSYLVILFAGGLITSIVGSWIVSTTIMTQAQRTAGHDLAAARTIYEHQLAVLRGAVALQAPALADRLPRDALGDADLALRLGSVRQEAGFDFLGVTDDRGRVRFRLSHPGRIGDTATAIAVVRAALEGRVAAASEVLSAAGLAREDSALAERARIGLVPTPQARPAGDPVLTAGLVQTVAAPIRDAGGRVRGVLYGGRLLNNDYEMVDHVWDLLYRGERYRREDVGTVTIFLGDVRIATTIRDRAGARAVGTRVSASVADAVLDRGESWHDRAFVVRGWYITAYEPIRNLEGAIVGILYVGVLEQAYASIRDRVILSFFAIATLGFILIMVITYAMISNITRPIGEMVAATRNITAGRFDQEVRPTSQGEIALLADSFNTMLASLRQMKADLEEWGRTLEEKVRDRTRQVMEMQVRVAQSERLASLGMLAAGVAHEVNNPLGGILALTALTLEDLPADHPDRHNLEVVLHQTERCRDIVRGLLDFSRQSEVAMQQLDVNTVLQETLALIAQQSAFFNVQIERQLGPDLPPVTGDRSQLQQVFLNILVNAVQAMKERGNITITTSAPDGREVRIRIADTGSGIAPDDIEKIFDPFFTTREGGRGTGLGLAIAYGIVTQHRGHIDVESTVGQGTTFTIRLPAAETADVVTGAAGLHA
jgi:two-component system NtrC family sensor kinase